MMVNVSRFVFIQGSVRDFISVYIKKVKDAVKANYAMPDDFSCKNEFMAELERVFDEEFSNCGFNWISVKRSLYKNRQ